jgi:thiamine pyrophosphate-dependent acetolactate synthase large subunit-like protein
VDITGADLLIDSLHRHGVRVIFGMPGSHTTALYDAIARHGGIRTVLVRNEQAAAFAADGYARVTGRPGVVCTTAGPGATNALTGIAEAYGDSIPVLLVAGHVNHDRVHLECGNYHEVDLESIFRPCTGFAGTVFALEHIPELVRQAFVAMCAGRPRSAALFLPQDLAAATRDKFPNLPGDPHAAGPIALRRLAPSAHTLEAAAELLNQAKRPILLAGGGAVWSDAGAALKQLAGRLDCPVITSLNGKGILDERDPHALGHARSARAREALPHADAMLAIGCRFTEVMTWFHKLRVPEQLVQIDLDAGQIGVNYRAKVGLLGDARTALELLLDQTPARRSEWGAIWQRARNAGPAHPECFIETLRAALPDDAVVFTDASEMALRMHTDWPAYAARTFFYPSNYIALGWGFPAAIGGAVGVGDRRKAVAAGAEAPWVVCVAGDGGFLMTSQELATAARYQLRLIAIVHNDSAYGAIKNLQRKQHGGRYLDTDLDNPDFVKLAEAFGVPAVRATDQGPFRAALAEALRRSGPSLIEVPDTWRSLRGH